MQPQPNREQPILPYVFYNLTKTGKTWRVLLQVSEGFFRVEEAADNGILQEHFFPTIVKFLMNAGRFPEINKVSLLEESNTFAIRLNLTWAYNEASAMETITVIASKLDVYLESGEIQNFAQLPQQRENIRSAFQYEEDDSTERLPVIDIEEPEEEEIVDESKFSSFVEFLQNMDLEDDEDNNDDINGLPVPIY